MRTGIRPRLGALASVALAGVALAVLLSPATAAAHPGRPPAPHDLASAWGGAPGAVVTLVAIAAAYAIGLRRLRRRAGVGRGVSDGAAVAFGLGWLALAVALVSPIHALGSALFAAHMTQHELLMVVAAPLLVLGRPLVAGAWALPRATHRVVARVARAVHPARALATPWAATIVHGIAVWVWHAPRLYVMALRHDAAHAAQHAAFLGTALLFWWAVLGPRARRRPGPAIAALFVTALHTSVLGALITFAQRPWTDAYLATTGAWGLTPIEDQQLAGLIMWIPGGVAYIVAALWLLAGVLQVSAPATQPRGST